MPNLQPEILEEKPLESPSADTLLKEHISSEIRSHFKLELTGRIIKTMHNLG
jgi:hypothetical protein